MPLFRPEIQEALRSVGLTTDKDESIADRLNNKGLSLDSVIENLSDVLNGADTSNVKLRAVETVLKLHGVLKEQPSPAPSITIVINDPDSSGQINPILLPRQLIKKDTVQ